jgi:hypothetical protein
MGVDSSFERIPPKLRKPMSMFKCGYTKLKNLLQREKSKE